MDAEPCLPFEDVSLEGLSQPLKGRTRIQYTCFTVSNQFIMIGTNTGGVYVFNRKSRQFVSILPGQAGGVTCLAVDGAEQLVAAGSVQGAVSVYACPTARSWSGQLTALARLDAEVRALCWRHAHWSGRLLYVGTAAGKVLAISVSKKKTPAASATITPMLQLDSPVCELVLSGQTLLASTIGFCYLCNVQMEVFAQVGTQPRSGRLGACFLGETVFCARPGLRLWEVRLSGQIVSTHQLRPALDDATPRRVVSACDQAACLQDGGSGGGKSALGLVKLVPMPGGAVAAFSGDAVFVLQLAVRRVVLWTSVHGKVRDLAAVGDELYVQCEGGAMRRLLVRQPSQIVRELRAGRGVAECARFLMSHGELTDLCRARLPLQVLRDAVKGFADDAPMQAELTRLAAVLRDRLAEEGVDVGEEERSAPAAPCAAAMERRESGPARGDSEQAANVEPSGAGDVRTEGELAQSEKQPENGDCQEKMATEIAAEAGEAPDTLLKEHEPVQNLQQSAVTVDESSVDSVVADSSSEEFRTAPSSEDRSVPSSEESAPFQPALPTRPVQSVASSDDAIVFRSSRRRRPRARGRPAEPQASRPPESHPPEPQSPGRPMSERPAQPPLQAPSQQPPLQPPLHPSPPPQPPTPTEWHDGPSGDARCRAAPAASQMGVYGYTPGLALHPEVLDVFSDLVEDVRGVVSSGAQRLVQRLRRQPSFPPGDSAVPPVTTAFSAGAGADAVTAPPGKAERPEQAQGREAAGTQGAEAVGCAVSAGDGRSSAAAAVRAEPSLAELTAAADTAELSLPAALRWLDAVAAVHCRLQPPSVSVVPAEGAATELKVATEVATEADGSGGAYPALERLCTEPNEFVCERSFPTPTQVREEVSRVLGRALLFLVCDEGVREALADCAVAAEGAPAVSREDSGVVTGGSRDASPTEGGKTDTVVMAASVESEAKGVFGHGEATSGNESEEAANAMNESRSAELSTDPDSGVHVSNKTGDLNDANDASAKGGGTDQSTGLEDNLGAILLEDETRANHIQESQSNMVAGADPTSTAKDAEVSPSAAVGGDSAADAEPEDLRSPSCPPAAGSPAWLAERLARRLFYLLRVADLRSRLTMLPAGPRGRLWCLLVGGTEARLGPFSVGPSDAAAALGLTAGAELDWLSLARLAAGLCRADPAVAAALCLQHSDRLAPLDALYICRHAAAPGHVVAAFTAYLTAAGAEAAGLLLADAELSAAAEATLVAVWRRQAARLRCRCGRPRPGAHRVPRPAVTLLRRLLSARLSGERLSRELWSLGDFSGWLKAGAAVEAAVSDSDSSPDSESDYESHLAAVLCQLDDSALLPAVVPLLSDWRPLLTALSAVLLGRCSGCGGPLTPADRRLRSAAARRPLTLQALLAFVTSQEGPEPALQLLQAASDVIPQQLTTSCYRDVILSTMLNRRAAGLGAAFGAEMLGLKPAPVPEEAVELLLAELGRPAPPPLPAAGHSSATVASLASDCPACCLPLRNRHLLQPHGLVTFGCGHAFHAVCLLRRGAGCLLCRH